jgi:hypothetical protein
MSFTVPLIQRFLFPISTILYKWENNVGIGAVSGNVWSRAARRKQQESSDIDMEIRLGFRITVVEVEDSKSRVDVEWRLGTDVVLFQSFCGKLKSIVQHS